PTDETAALRTRDELYGHAGQKGKSGRAIKMARPRWANYWENGAIIQGSGAFTQGDRRAADCGNGISLTAATVCRLLRHDYLCRLLRRTQLRFNYLAHRAPVERTPTEPRLRRLHHRAHLAHRTRARLGDGCGNRLLHLLPRRSLRQILFNHNDLRPLFISQIRAPALLILLDGIAPLLH